MNPAQPSQAEKPIVKFPLLMAPVAAAGTLSAAPRRAPRIVGETYFIGYAAKPRTHTVDNIGNTAYRVDVFQGADIVVK